MSNFNTSGLLQALDRIKPELKPLPQHFITSQDQHTRESYATLLAAVLLSGGQVSEPQSRLFGMLLQSMQLDPVPARFFELAQQLDAGQLKGAIRGIQPVGQSFALDALILARLSAPLDQQQLHMIAELFDVLEISQEIASITKATIFVLGLFGEPELIDFDLGLTNKSSILKQVFDRSKVGDLFNKGVWTDPYTGLMWWRINLGQGFIDGHARGSVERMSWRAADEIFTALKMGALDNPKGLADLDKDEVEEAMAAIGIFRLGGFVDWRLPNKDELKTIALKNGGYNAPDGVFYPPDLSEPDDSGQYWSASPDCDDDDDAWVVDFNHGFSKTDWKGRDHTIRAVRGIAKKQLSEPSQSEK